MRIGIEARRRADLVAVGATLARLGLIRGREGNLSSRLDTGTVLLTPRGADKGRLSAPDLVRCVVDEPPPRGASSEALTHLAVYRRYPAIGAIVHAHPTATLALAARALAPDPNLLEEGRALVPNVELVAPLPPGSEELAHACADALGRAPVVVVRAHGVFGAGVDAWQAMERVQIVEVLATMALTNIGPWVEI
jgi:ribulose-5-phosphate 4-epimerase/fuculose-1-phosphate aldolase